MKSEEWNRLIDLFHQAREKSGRDRAMVLDASCGDNAVLRQAIEELLREDEAANGYLSEPLLKSLRSEPALKTIVSGQRVGRYITLALIGRGGMGEVWSAQDTDLDRIVALKFLNPETFAGLDSQQITREAKAASALNHPRIVTIHEVVQHGAIPALVMELVEGTSLREVCGRPMPFTEVLAIGVQIAEALAAAHASGTIHGDIKPENILLRPDGNLKLLDFGLARKVTTEAIASGSAPTLGTLRYMSPEQARGEVLTPASDTFSLGLVLYELLAGRHAFPGFSPLDTAHGILEKDPPPLASLDLHVPGQFDLLLSTMLAKKPSDRPGDAETIKTLQELSQPRKSWLDAVPAQWKWAVASMLVAAVCLGGWRLKLDRERPTVPQVTTFVPEIRATASALSSDGKLAAYANVDGVFLRTIGSGQTRALSAPTDFIIDQLAWFTDGTKLVASGFSTTTNVPSVWLIAASGAGHHLVRPHARGGIPSPDGKQIAYTSEERDALWVMGTDGEDQRKVVSSTRDTTFPILFWSPDGRRLSFQRRYFHQAGHLYRYESADVATGRITTSAQTIVMNAATSLADGRILFLGWDNNDYAASHQLWEVKTDPATGALQGTPHELLTLPGEDATNAFDLTASADGKRAMALLQSKQNSIFVGDFDQHPPRISNLRRLTLDDRANFPHAWTSDSRSVIFESDRNGNFDLFRQSIDQRTPQTIVATPMIEILPQLSPDGRYVLYAVLYGPKDPESNRPPYSAPKKYKLLRVPIEGGTPQEVAIGGLLDEFRCALRANARCVLRTMEGEWRTYYDLDPIRGKGRELARIKFSDEMLGDWDISPDGTQVAIPDHRSLGSQIRLVSLDRKRNQPVERAVVVPGGFSLRGLTWAADGGGWFVSIDTSVGRRIIYVHLDGRFDPLGNIEFWAVPSPDGHRVACLNSITGSNAWLIERK